MARIVFGIALFLVVAYTIGYFIVRFKKSGKNGGQDRTPLQVGARILVLMIGVTAIIFALFVAYTFSIYLFNKK